MKIRTGQIDPSISEGWNQQTGGIAGWGSYTENHVYWKQIGKMVYMSISLQGTSNSTSTNILLPVTPSTHCNYYEGQIGLAMDNGAVVGPGRWSIDNVTITPAQNVSFFTSQAGGGWTASGTKQVRATLFYEAA